jgi:hypothetical protein
MIETSLKTIYENLINLLKGYIFTYRKTYDPSSYNPALTIQANQSLFSHIGELPIIASYLHRYIGTPVDLGKTLIILSVHDIGETVTGDILTFDKGDKTSENNEYLAAKSLLNDEMFDYYLEYKYKSTNEAKYAYSIDKFGPLLLDIICGKDASFTRLNILTGWNDEDIITNLSKHNRQHMLWSTFLTDLYDYMLLRFDESDID